MKENRSAIKVRSDFLLYSDEMVANKKFSCVETGCWGAHCTSTMLNLQENDALHHTDNYERTEIKMIYLIN